MRVEIALIRAVWVRLPPGLIPTYVVLVAEKVPDAGFSFVWKAHSFFSDVITRASSVHRVRPTLRLRRATVAENRAIRIVRFTREERGKIICAVRSKPRYDGYVYKYDVSQETDFLISGLGNSLNWQRLKRVGKFH